MLTGDPEGKDDLAIKQYHESSRYRPKREDAELVRIVIQGNRFSKEVEGSRESGGQARKDPKAMTRRSAYYSSEQHGILATMASQIA